jgi:hypothetical protein
MASPASTSIANPALAVSRAARTLAQPLPPAWSAAYHAAVDETEKIKDMKKRQKEMEDMEKRMVQLVVYYKVRFY